MNVVLALDLGTNTGYAYRLPSGAIFSGSWDFRPRRFEGGGMRYLRFRRMLDQFGSGNTVGAVYFEEVRRHVGTDAAHVYGGLMGTLEAWCEERKIPYRGTAIGSWKRHLPGLKGNAKKDEVMAAINSLGYTPVSQDEADAIGVLLYELSLLQSSSP